MRLAWLAVVVTAVNCAPSGTPAAAPVRVFVAQSLEKTVRAAAGNFESAHPGTVVELSEVAGPKGEMFRLIRDASEGWDGKDPVRPFPDLRKLSTRA